MDSSEPSSSGMSGTVPNKKRKSGEEKLTASERSKLWRQQQKERDPEGFREREQSRTRERRQNKQRNQIANLSNSLPIMSNKETQTDVTLAENEIILKCTPLSDSPGRYQFVDPTDRHRHIDLIREENDMDCDTNTGDAWIQDTNRKSSQFGDILNNDTNQFNNVLQPGPSTETQGIPHDAFNEWKINTLPEFRIPVTTAGSSIENNPTYDNPTIDGANLKPFDPEIESSPQFPSVPDTRTATDFCPEVAAQGKIPSIPVLFGKTSIDRSNACQNMMLTGDCDQPATPSSDETVMHSGSVAPESPLLPPGSVTSLILDMEQDFPKPVDIVDNDSLSQIARRPIQVTTGNSNHIEESNTGGRTDEELYKEDGNFTFISKNKSKKGKTEITDLLKFGGKVFIRRLDENFIEEVDQTGKVENMIKFSNSGTGHHVKDVAMSQRNGAIWFCCIDNSVNKYEDGKCTEKFRTRFRPKFLYVDSSNSKENLFVCLDRGLEIWDDEGKEGKCIDLYKPLSGPNGKKEMFYPDTVDKDAVSGKVLVISSESVPILLDKSLKEPTFIKTIPVRSPTFQLYCGCFNHAGDIIVGTSSGVYVLSGVNYEVLTTWGPRYGMEPILCLPNYDLWVGCYDEIYRYSYQNKKKQLTQASTSGSHL